MARLFGTDGIRGIANEDMNVELALSIGGRWSRCCLRGGGAGPWW